MNPENADCIAGMTGDMVSQLSTFPFDNSLQDIAANHYYCAVVDNDQ